MQGILMIDLTTEQIHFDSTHRRQYSKGMGLTFLVDLLYFEHAHMHVLQCGLSPTPRLLL